MAQESIQQRLHSLIWSGILDLENADNPDNERRKAISAWKTLAQTEVDTSASVEQAAYQFAALDQDDGLAAFSECFGSESGPIPDH